MSPILRQDLLRSGPLLLPAAGLVVFLLGVRLVGSLVQPGWALEEGYPEWVLVALTPFAWLVVRELGVREWVEGGHAAREALPLRPLRVYVEKVLLGAALLVGLAVVGSMLLSTALRLLRQADHTLPEQLLRGACAWLAVVYGVLWCLAACGRHRHAVTAWLAVLLLGADATGLLPWRALPPLRLATEGFLGPPERARDCLLAGLGLLALGSAPWWLLRGRLTRAWSGPAGRGDLVAVAAAGALLLLVPAYGRALSEPPLRLEGEVAEAGPVRVRAPLAPDERQAAAALAGSAALTLAPLSTELGLAPAPVGVELARGQHGFLRADLRGRRGVLVRVDWADPGFAGQRFQAWLLREALDEATRGRLREDPWRWLLDGWPAWRAGLPAREQALDELRLAFAARTLRQAGLLGPGLLDGWEGVRAQVGEELARELAGWCVGELAAASGAEAPSRLLREVAAARLAPLAALRAPAALGPALARAGVGEPEAFEARLRAGLEAALERQSAALAGCAPPAWEAFRLEPVPGAGGVWLRLQVPAGGPADAPAALLVAPDRGALPERWDRGELLPGEEPLELGPWPAGSVVWVTWTRRCAELGGLEAISGWRRMALP